MNPLRPGNPSEENSAIPINPQKTGATFKLGIRHEDWRRKGFTYYGPIDDPHQVIKALPGAPSDYLNVYAIAAGRPIEDMHMFGPLLRQWKAPYALKADGSPIRLGPHSARNRRG